MSKEVKLLNYKLEIFNCQLFRIKTLKKRETKNSIIKDSKKIYQFGMQHVWTLKQLLNFVTKK